ncbi:MAG: AgmX/PglI C-terminal domain-containing protein [Oligoflexia bacterium]|nr:AgmX/PglI C-terminal domain-containing protein [Oligoflexia bacterium]
MRQLLGIAILLLIVGVSGYFILKDKQRPLAVDLSVTPISNPSVSPSPSIPNLLTTPASTATPPPQLQKAKNEDTLSDKEIAKVMQTQMTELNRCYGRYARKNPEARGQIKTSISISPNGNVIKASVLNSPDKELEKCLVGILKNLHFRKFGGSNPININYPMNFE